MLLSVLHVPERQEGFVEILTIVAGLLIAAAFAFAFRKLLAPKPATSQDLGRISEFSIHSYAPLFRLFSAEDEQFLRSQAGFREEIYLNHRRQRALVCKKYLRNLSKDFQALHRSARILAAHAPAGYEDLGLALMKQSAVFWISYGAVYARVSVEPILPTRGAINLDRLVSITGWMQEQLQSLSAVPTPA